MSQPVCGLQTGIASIQCNDGVLRQTGADFCQSSAGMQGQTVDLTFGFPFCSQLFHVLLEPASPFATVGPFNGIKKCNSRLPGISLRGDLSRVKRVVKVLGMVNSTPDFVEQPAVINGFSDLIVEVFGERGKHARAAVGMASLPRGQAVEIEMIVEVED